MTSWILTVVFYMNGAMTSQAILYPLKDACEGAKMQIVEQFKQDIRFALASATCTETVKQ